MQEPPDAQLLRDYAGRGSETAFREIVTRHTDLVYSAALRQVNSPDLAWDIAQRVFTDLARAAKKVGDRLPANASLAGWLYRGTRYTVLNQLRDDRRRSQHERQAMEQLLTNSGSAPDWEQIRPLLDEAMDGLNDEEREALLLRYFKNHDFRTVGLALGVSDDAAQKRVSRAVERLREFFSKRNVTIGGSGLAVLISANAVQSAPVGLAAAISTAAVLTGTAVSTSTVIAATKTIAMTTLQKTIIGATLAAAVGTGVFEAHQASQLRKQNQILQQQQSALSNQIQQLQLERDDATNQLAALEAENAQLQADQNEAELLKLRNEVTQLQTAAGDSTTAAAKNWLVRVSKLKQWAEQNPGATIPEFQFLTPQDWLTAAQKPLKNDVNYRRAMGSLRNYAEGKFASVLQSALQGYMQANAGQFPNDLNQLQPYFGSSVDDAMLKNWEIAPASTVKSLRLGGDFIITQKAPVDDVFDTRWGIGPNGTGSTDFLPDDIWQTMQPVYDAYRATHEGRSETDMSQLLPYATTPDQQAALQKLILRQSTNSK